MSCYYKILEVSREATDDEIKKSYRRLAIRWHPDKNKENKLAATETFKKIGTSTTYNISYIQLYFDLKQLRRIKF